MNPGSKLFPAVLLLQPRREERLALLNELVDHLAEGLFLSKSCYEPPRFCSGRR